MSRRGRREPVVTRSVVYAIGDIHGMFALLQELLGEIAADSPRYDGAEKTLVYLGDYIDRGPQSREVVELLMGKPMQAHGFEEVFLKGNHEELMEVYYDASDDVSWLYNGGRETLASYDGEVDAAHRASMRDLPLSHATPGYFFVHAGVDPGRPLGRQLSDDMLWIRRSFTEDTKRYTYNRRRVKVVHGHTIARQPQIRDNRIGIDTGAFATGVLTAVALDGTEERILQVTGEPSPAHS